MLLAADELGYSVSDKPNSSPAQLARVFIFNPELSTSEQDTHLKILFHWPPSVAVFDQAQAVGLVQGLAGFTKQFAPDEECQVSFFRLSWLLVKVQALTRPPTAAYDEEVQVAFGWGWGGLGADARNTRLSFYNPEPNFFLVLMVENPTLSAEGDGKTQWHERELQPMLLQRALGRLYDTFHLIYGTLAAQMVLLKGPDGLRSLLDRFMAAYLPVLDMSRQDLFAVLDGLSYLPCDRNLWLAVQCVVNEVELEYPEVTKSAVFFKENLICSSMDVSQLRAVCHYLFQFPPNRAVVRDALTSGGSFAHRSQYPIHLGGEEHHMLVFRVAECMVVLFASDLKSFAVVEPVQAFLLARAQPLVDALRASWDRMLRGDAGFRYVYYNSINWAIKTSLGGSRKIARETLQVMTNMHAALSSDGANAPSEIVLRTAEGTWLVAKKVDQRELFIVFENSNDTLLDIEQQCRALSTTYLSSIFF